MYKRLYINTHTSVIRANDIHPIVEDGKYINYPVFRFDEQRLFETYRIEIAPQGMLQAAPHLAGTEEYITVFEGTVEISVNEKRFCLSKGDSIKFKADTPHGYKNVGELEAQLSMLIYYGK